MIAVTLTDLGATEALAQALAPLLAECDVVELVGDIGAGKTTFTGALVRALGGTEPVRSPTYTIAHRYELPAAGPAAFLAHLDCYRQRGELDDAAWGDVEPYFEGGIACVEWPAPIRPWLADRRTWRVHLDTASLGSRVARVELPASDLQAAALFEFLCALCGSRPSA
ncbi:MAG: tRNA (adenosine(37)-N6)-threonylcarbamoyltransferase complex ATPase subunit type 1 TsaE [Thermoleophilia bacterium]|nr:tRNA (adenosine(37)-N6)-threonylcarbamoyltransferase complex ATPase subunit type 1 TsaE [Thermoleophilia bacterium]